jgi:hypothetical protein
MKKTCNQTGRWYALSVLLLLFLTSLSIAGQSVVYSYYYRVYFKDKGISPESYSASDLLSERSIRRRVKAGITVPDINDIPVSSEYLKGISSYGLTLHCKSKWMNTAVFKTQSPIDMNVLRNLSYISNVKLVKIPGIKSGFNDKLFFVTEQLALPPYDRPVTQLNGLALHEAGFTGKNMLIAILDGGFINSDNISSLEDLRTRNGIIATHDFVKNSAFVYNAHNHGTAVLSVLAGNIPGYISGSAPDADYILLKTEDVDSEFPCEEDFWAAGAEYADSAGVDIISSSLGYYNFDDPSMDYKISDLDGNTAFVTKVADIAASKGILVVNSAGNERDNPWQKIIFPSDGDSVLAAGAVDGNNIISSFSSAGPSTDGRIKPDNAAMGVSVPVQIVSNVVSRSSGTSFSCPVLSGFAACLMQAAPEAGTQEIIEMLHFSGDRYSHPDSLYGYGIPDLIKALFFLREKHSPGAGEMTVFPNPTSGDFDLIFLDPPGGITIEIISVAGKLISRKEYPDFTGNKLTINDLHNQAQGIYFLKVIHSKGTLVSRIIRIKN